MIVDSSVLVAVLAGETEAPEIYSKLANSEAPASMSAASYFETAIVIDSRRNPELSEEMDRLIAELDIEIVPVSVEQAHLARAAYQKFGKGSGHPARLNFGDCFAYALAKQTGEPLLFKGNDFSATDLPAA